MARGTLEHKLRRSTRTRTPLRQVTRAPSDDESSVSSFHSAKSSSSGSSGGESGEAEFSSPETKRSRRPSGKSVANKSLSVGGSTPKGRKLPVRTLKKVSMPKRDLADLTNDDFENAKRKLHVSHVPEGLIGREDEFASVYSHLYHAVSENRGCCLCKATHHLV